MKRVLACGGVTGGNTVTRDFGSWRSSSGTDWEQFSPEERERIGGQLSEESTAGKNGVREINVALILGCALSGIYSPDRRLSEVEDKKTAKSLLKDEVRLLWMKRDSPTHGVETFQGGGREALRIQVGDEKLGITVFSFNTDDLERKGSKTSTFRL